MDDKVELIAQPQNGDKKPLNQETLEKLRKLIEENEVDSEEERIDDDGEVEIERAPSPSRTFSHETARKHEKEGVHEDSEVAEESKYDEDGFKIPAGKIPLDGHFSAAEIDQLIQIAKSEGLLDEDVRMKVLEKTQLGDKVVIAEEHEKKTDAGRQDQKQESKS